MKFSFLEKFGVSVLLTAWLIWGGSQVANLLVTADESAADAFRTAPEPARPTAAEARPEAKSEPRSGTEAEPAAAAGDPKTLLAAASVEAGAKVFKKCKGCHSDDKGSKSRVGPPLWGVVGRAKGSVDGFAYSPALKGLGGGWSYADLDAFLAAPKAFAPGNKMPFRGLTKDGDRAAVIVYLRSLSDSPKPLP